MSVKELSRRTGVSEANLGKLYHEKSLQIAFNTMSKLCEVLEVPLSELFEYMPDKK